MSRCKRKETACVCGMIAIAGGTHTQVKSVGNSNREVKQKKVVAKSRRIYIYIRPATKAIQSQQLKKEGVVASATRPIQAALWEVQTSLSLFLSSVCLREMEKT